MRRFNVSVVLCLVIVLLGCNDSSQQPPPAVPSPQLSPQVTLPPDTTKVSLALTDTPVPADTPPPADTPLPTDTPAPAVTPVLAIATPDASGLQILQYSYYGDDIPINFVGVLKNTSDKPIKRPLILLEIKDADGSVIAKARDTILGGVINPERSIRAPISSELGPGQSAGFQIQIVNKLRTWHTIEVRALAVTPDPSFQPYFASRSDIKVVNPEMRPGDYGYTVVHGELEGEMRADAYVTVVATAFDDAGKVLDVGYGTSGAGMNDFANGKRTFDLVWKRNNMKVAKYDFACFANKELNRSGYTDR